MPPRKRRKNKNGLTSAQVKEVRRCAADPEYFIMNYCKIRTHKGAVLFKLYDYQRELLGKFHKNRNNIILKGRQLGISELSAAFSNWLIVFHKHKTVSILATDMKQAIHLMDKVKLSYDNLPDWIKAQNPKENDNQQMIKLKNGSSVMSYSSSVDAVRGTTPSLLIIDEAAFIDDIDGIWSAAKPALTTGGACIVLSTPFGAGTWYHKQWLNAIEGLSTFVPTLLMWDVHPDRDQDWYAQELLDLGERKMAQEYECSFNASGDTVVHPDILKYIEDNYMLDPVHKIGIDGQLWIWEEYKDGHGYCMSVDCARGDAEDYHGAHIIDTTTMEQVAEYRGKVPLDDYSEFLYNLAQQYDNPLMVVENNTYGYTVLKSLLKKGYKNLYYSKRKTKYDEEKIDSKRGMLQDNMIPGFNTSASTRPMIVTIMENFLRNKTIKIRSSRLLNELRSFIWKGHKPQAAKGSHDDLVMSLCIGCFIVNNVFIEGGDKRKINMAIMNSFRKNSTVFNTDTGHLAGVVYSGSSMNTQRQQYMDTHGRYARMLDDSGGRKKRKVVDDNKKKNAFFLPIYKG